MTYKTNTAAYVRYRPLVEPLIGLLPTERQAQVRALLDRIGTYLAEAQLATTTERALEKLGAA